MAEGGTANLSGKGDRRAVLIAGPTASGKSALALELAERRNGVVINADSMQVYAELAILSARPSAADLAAAPHRLYGHVPASERYTVARWRGDAAAALADAWTVGRLPIVVGGTGLYFKALAEGLAAVPAIPPAIEARLAAEAAAKGVPALHARLARLDPEAGTRLSPNDRTRVIRALAVIEATGRPLRDWQAGPGLPPLVAAEATARIVLEPARGLLGERIGRRLEAMAASGALDEVAALLALRLDPALPAMKAIGVAEFSAHLDGSLPLADAIGRAATATRQYAKRQRTWFRHQMADWRRAESVEAAIAALC